MWLPNSFSCFSHSLKLRCQVLLDVILLISDLIVTHSSSLATSPSQILQDTLKTLCCMLLNLVTLDGIIFSRVLSRRWASSYLSFQAYQKCSLCLNFGVNHVEETVLVPRNFDIILMDKLIIYSIPWIQKCCQTVPLQLLLLAQPVLHGLPQFPLEVHHPMVIPTIWLQGNKQTSYSRDDIRDTSSR